MRMFIAIEFEPEVREYLSEVQKKFLPVSRRGNFTDIDNLHLTLKFIGEVERDDIDYLAQAVREVGSANKCFSLNLSHLGFFPKGNRTIVWAGVEESQPLLRLFGSLEKSLMRQGFPRERKGLSPHITLGREVDLTEKFDTIKAQIPLDKKQIKVTKISLMESKRMGAKLVYKPVYVQLLK
ncbi:RNA 2',3'-cyclic phosphodiesterase [bioreactor metagenome]|uniref:RNA 2',3'-cyclic phosphodiesterase n=1 Tax=bioreactor metagenome TaxID=1076179 RepID=A0A645CR73_9ZZZZ|nr:RNA 2',3'-cyclic phosphodiesterase [Lachnospiraceae bacterium]